MTQPEQFDAIIIGVGQAGKPLAIDLAAAGWNMVIVERNYAGGSCINYGCTPTKTLLASAKVAHQARHSSAYGVDTGRVQIDFKAVIDRKNKVVEQFRSGIEDKLTSTDNLTFLEGEAFFSGPKQVTVSLNDGGERTLTADHIFIDTGTHPAQPDLPGLDTVDWLTSTTLMDATELPKHLLILGGGYIGVEFSQMFRRFGSEVTIIQRGPQLLDREDADIADALTSVLTNEGITVYCNATAERVSKTKDGGIELVVKTKKGTQTLTGTHLLIAIGTAPNTDALNLKAADITTDKHGFIPVNERLETNQSGIYATGDVNGGPAFTHISYDDYRILRDNLLHNGNRTITGRPVPYTVFTDPQLGRIGLNETQAREQKKNIRVASMPMSSVARAIEVSETNGLMKVIIDANTDQILGASILGIEGGELMSMLQLAMKGKLTTEQLKETIFAHPTLAESLNSLSA